MRLFFYDFAKRFPGLSNFGDNLNLWLWEKLLPDVLNQDPSTIFVGIGTILNRHEIPKAQHTVVFSSGAGYGEIPKGFKK